MGYSFIDYPENVDRRFFAKGTPRTYHFHLVEQGSQTYPDHIDFREALCKHDFLRQRYQVLKSELAERFSKDRRAYTDHKSDFISEALKFYRSQNG